MVCECSIDILAPQVMELGDLVAHREAELRELRQIYQSKAVATPDIASLACENELLAWRACESAEQVAALRVEEASLSRKAEADEQWAVELQGERRQLLDRIGSLETTTAEAQQRHEAMEGVIEAEQRKTGERASVHEDALEALHHSAQNVERRWASAEAAAAQLEARQVEVKTDALAESKASTRASEARRRQAAELEAQLVDAKALVQDSENQQQRELLASELAEERARATELQDVEKSLIARLAESQQCGSETEQKALTVARELVDSSQSIAWLRAELSMQQSLRLQLEDAERRGGWLKQSLMALQEEALSGGGGELQEPTPAPRDSSAAELSELQAQQVSTVNEALRAAWEATARDHRLARRRLDTLRSRAQPVQQQLARLADTLAYWREHLAGAELPPPPQIGWDDSEEALQEAGRGLFTCFQALTTECRRRMVAAEAPPTLPLAAVASSSSATPELRSSADRSGAGGASEAAGAMAWPASPVPQPRVVATTAPLGPPPLAAGIVGLSRGSSLSSVSLHDRRAQLELPPVAPEDEGAEPTEQLMPRRRLSNTTQGEEELPGVSLAVTKEESLPASSSTGTNVAAERLQELQRQVNDLARRSLTKSRLEAVMPHYGRQDWSQLSLAAPSRRAIVSSPGSTPQAAAKRGGRRRQITVRQIPISQHNLMNRVVDAATERFDEYSIHRPLRRAGVR